MNDATNVFQSALNEIDECIVGNLDLQVFIEKHTQEIA
jgi:hypothetical protein